MELTVLGSGTGVPHPHRGAPGHLLRAGERTILLDCGPGSLHAAAAAGVSPGQVDAIVLSHLHPDHTLDLQALFFALKNPAFADRGPLQILGPRGLFDVVEHWLSGPQGAWLEPAGYHVDLREVAPGEQEVCGLSARAFAVLHTEGALAWRFTDADGAVLAYSGDSGVCEGVVDAGRGADLFLLECALPDPPPWEGHLTPRTAARVAARAEPKRLVLTHFYPEVEAEPIVEIVSERYSGPVDLAVDGETYIVG